MTKHPLSRIVTLTAVAFSSIVSGQESITERLTLKEVIARALGNNQDIEVTNLEKVVELERIKMARQAFDPVLEGSYVYQSIDTPQNTQDFIATGGGVGSPSNPADPILTSPRIFEQRNNVGKLAISSRLPTGTGIELGTTMRVLDNTLNRNLPPSLFNPEWESFTGVTLTQPLLKNFGVSANLAEIRIARANAKIADLEWQAQTAQTVSEVMKRYYDLVFTRQNVLVQQEALDLAQKLLEDTEKRGKEGVAAGNDVVVAQAGVSERLEELLAARVQDIERQNALQMLFRRAEEIIAISYRVEPVDGLVDRLPETNRATLMSLATNNRYEVRQAEEAIAVRRSQTRLATSQSRPSLDLVASGGLHGMAGGFDRTYSEAFSGQGPEWTAGLQFSMPLNYDRLRAGKRLAQIQETQATVQREKVRLRVALEVDTVLARLKADLERLSAARKSEEASKLSVGGELKRLKEGLSTSYQVLQLQKEYAQTRSRVLAAKAELNKDLADLYLATGTVLEKQNVILDAPPAKPVTTMSKVEASNEAAAEAKGKTESAQPRSLFNLFRGNKDQVEATPEATAPVPAPPALTPAPAAISAPAPVAPKSASTPVAATKVVVVSSTTVPPNQIKAEPQAAPKPAQPKPERRGWFKRLIGGKQEPAKAGTAQEIKPPTESKTKAPTVSRADAGESKPSSPRKGGFLAFFKKKSPSTSLS